MTTTESITDPNNGVHTLVRKWMVGEALFAEAFEHRQVLDVQQLVSALRDVRRGSGNRVPRSAFKQLLGFTMLIKQAAPMVPLLGIAPVSRANGLRLDEAARIADYWQRAEPSFMSRTPR